MATPDTATMDTMATPDIATLDTKATPDTSTKKDNVIMFRDIVCADCGKFAIKSCTFENVCTKCDNSQENEKLSDGADLDYKQKLQQDIEEISSQEDTIRSNVRKVRGEIDEQTKFLCGRIEKRMQILNTQLDAFEVKELETLNQARKRYNRELEEICRIKKNSPESGSENDLSSTTGRTNHGHVKGDEPGRNKVHFSPENSLHVGRLARYPEKQESLKATAQFSYAADQEDELSFRAGDIITEVKQVAAHWWEGRLEDRNGTFPSNFVRLLDGGEPLEECPKAKVLFDYQAAAADELSLKSGDLIDVIEQGSISKGWAYGLKGEERGLFPINFVDIIQQSDGGDSSNRTCVTEPDDADSDSSGGDNC